MRLERRGRRLALGTVLLGFACGGGSGGGTGPCTPGAATFTVTASAAPTTAAVDVKDNFFSPQNGVIKTGGTVTWTWGGATSHTLTFTSGPAPLPVETPAQMTGTRAIPFNTVATYGYH